nr:hypothetical protein [Tanacetum cinerariifolium]
MNPVATQQVALDNSLVAPEKRLKTKKCNARIAFRKPQREETYQVTLDALKLSPCYPAFLITAEVPEVYMHQFWNTIKKVKDTDAYRFKLDKKFRVDTEVFHEILHICPRILNQDFIASPSEEELVTFIQELGYSGKCDMLSAIHTDQMHQPWRTFDAIINRYISGKQQDLIDLGNHELKSFGDISMRNRINLHIICDDSLLDTTKKARKYKKVASPSRKLSPVLEEEPTEKPKVAKKPTKKSTTVPTAGVFIRDTPGVLDESQDKTTGTDEGTGAKLGVPDVPKYLSESEIESWGDSGNDESSGDGSDELTKDDDEDDVKSDANEDKEASDSENTDSNDENLNFNQNDDEEEEHDDDSFEFNEDDKEYYELYKDVNVRSKVAEHEEVGKGDVEMTDTAHESAFKENSYEQVIKDAHVTLTSSQKTEGSKQSSYVSSDFASKFLNLDNVPPVVDEVASLMNVVLAKSSSQRQSTYGAAASLTEFELKKILLDKLEKSKSYRAAEQHKDLYDVLVKSYQLKKDLFNSYEKAYSLKSGHEDKDKDEDPPARADQSSSKGSKSHSKLSGKSAQAEEPVFEIADTEMPQDQRDDLGNTEDQLNVKEASKHDCTINESLEKVVLAKSSSQRQSTYGAAASLTEFELKKILLDKLEKSKSYQAAEQYKDLYDVLVKSYQLKKDLFNFYEKAYSLKSGREDKDKDEDPPARADQSSSKGSKSHSKLSGKSAQAEEPVFEIADTEMPQDQRDEPERPPTPDRDWNAGKQIDFKPPQTWINKTAKARKPPTTFDELMSTPIDF